MADLKKPIDPFPKVWNPETPIGEMLRGKCGLVVGVANENSIAFGCAAKLRAFGARVGLTYGDAKSEQYVRPLADQIQVDFLLPMNVECPGEMSAVFDYVRQTWGRLDFVVHSIAFAPGADLHGRVVDCSLEGFQRAMHISCYSFIEMAHHAEPLMSDGGALITMSYYGSEKVVTHYNIMGPVKAALEATTRYLSAELGCRNIRVFAVSPGPMQTRAASGISHFDELIEAAVSRSPGGRLVRIEEVGRVVAFLVGGAASGMSGDTIYVDAGLHNVA